MELKDVLNSDFGSKWKLKAIHKSLNIQNDQAIKLGNLDDHGWKLKRGILFSKGAFIC